MNHNSPFMKILETIANMLIVSFFWIVCSLPIVTIIPSSVALYHTANKVIFNGRGQHVTRDFFKTLKNNLFIGVKVNLVYLFATFFVFVGMYAALQIYTWNIFGTLYLILAILITLVYTVSLIYIPAVISKFYLSVIDTIRLSVFFAMQNIFISILNVLLLVLLVLIVNVFPIAIVIVPALYVDLTRIGIEKKMKVFIEVNDLEQNTRPIEEEIKEEENVSPTDINDRLSRKKSK